MSDEVTLYQLGPSPNSIKARLALAFKSVPHRRVDCDPADRSVAVKLSGQPLLPVLTHGDRVIYDSYAILRYVDANWPAAPRLYAADRDVHQEIERWELFNRAELQLAVGTVFNQLFSGAPPEAAALRLANVQLAQAALKLEAALEQGEWLVGGAPTAADLTCAPTVYYGLLQAPAGPIQAFFAEHLRLPPTYPRTRAWVERVMQWDR
ncbi:MAG: glutathione S-transferase family protein [Planctomycetes bacterium]|nr:glutathione S-transferase family protein [Planctomycetota bacterium]